MVLKSLAENNSIEELILDGNTFKSKEVARLLHEYLAHSQTLKKLSMADCNFSAKCLPAFHAGLSQNSSILELRMDGNKFGKKGFDILAQTIFKMKAVEHISFKRTDLNSFFFIDFLEIVFGAGTETRLSTIDISRTLVKNPFSLKQVGQRYLAILQSVHHLIFINREAVIAK